MTLNGVDTNTTQSYTLLHTSPDQTIPTCNLNIMESPSEIRLVPSMLPQGDNVIFEESSFFTRHSSLPSPADVLAAAREQDPERSQYTWRPPPVTFKSLNLLVKYGTEITIAEGQCLWAIRRLLKESIPVPEVYGWQTEGDMVFIFMELMHGVTLEERYPSLSPEEKSSIAHQLKVVTTALRSLKQDPADPFVGHIGRQPLQDVLFDTDPNSGPFPSITALLDYYADYATPPAVKGTIPLVSYRYELPDDGPITFTHGDLHRRNIMVSAPGDGDIRLVAIVDWHQSGWLPPFWEWCKAYWCIPMKGDDWTEYLPIFLEPFEAFPYWSYFGLCIGM
ncbi:hypothetical protein ACG7TL_001529 [Trametes sanguinea]